MRQYYSTAVEENKKVWLSTAFYIGVLADCFWTEDADEM